MKQKWQQPILTCIDSSLLTLSGNLNANDENPSMGGGNEEPDATKRDPSIPS